VRLQSLVPSGFRSSEPLLDSEELDWFPLRPDELRLALSLFRDTLSSTKDTSRLRLGDPRFILTVLVPPGSTCSLEEESLWLDRLNSVRRGRLSLFSLPICCASSSAIENSADNSVLDKRWDLVLEELSMVAAVPTECLLLLLLLFLSTPWLLSILWLDAFFRTCCLMRVKGLLELSSVSVEAAPAAPAAAANGSNASSSNASSCPCAVSLLKSSSCCWC